MGTAQDSDPDTTIIDIQNPLENQPREYEILGIEVEGNRSVGESFVRSTSGLQEGTEITIPGEALSEGIKRLYRTGLFSDVQIEETGITGNGINLLIQVEEQPRMEAFEIRGVKRSHRRDLEEQINLVPGFALTESSKSQAVNTIERYFQNEGYWYTEVDVSTEVSGSDQNRVMVYFDIDPGERLEIKEINFEGNESFSNRKLRRQLDTIKKDAWWKIFGKKLFKEDDYEEAQDNLAQFYRDNGFRDFRITEDSVYTYEYKEGKEGIAVNFSIEEGPQYKVRDITWDGNTEYSDERLTESLGFEEGEIFNQTKFDENLNYNQSESDVTSLYNNVGYLFFQVQPEISVVGEDSLDIHLNIYEDEIATIHEVSFTGNTKTHDDVVRRTLRTIPGNTYSRSSVIRSIRELGNLGYFQPDAIEPDMQPDRENSTVDIIYNLDESQSTDNFEFSGGFGGRGIGLILSARLNFNNFSIQRAVKGEGWNPIPSGDGQELSLGVQVTGSGYQSYSVGFQEPWLSGKPVSLGVNSSYDLIRYRGSDVRNELFSSSVSVGRRLQWPDDYFQQRTILSYRLYDVAGASFLAEGTSSILSLRQVIERNSLDNMISPTAGSKIELSGEIAPPLPGFSQFYKLKSSYQNHSTVVGKLVLTNTVEYGYLGYLGDLRQSNFQRFKLGGTQLQQRQSFLDDNIDLRGFPGGQGGSITPIEDGEEIGGRLYSKYSMELRYPAISEEQVQIIPYGFFDAGNAYRDFDNFSPFDVKRATGMGVRIYLPILGLVDLSYGYRLDGIPNTSVESGEWEFLFNIGAPF